MARREDYAALPITITKAPLERLQAGYSAYVTVDPTFPRATPEGWLEGAIDVEYGMQDASYVREVIQASREDFSDA
jgi:ribosomal protein L21E